MSNTDVIAQIFIQVGQDMVYMLPLLDMFFDAAFGITERRRRP